MRYGYEQQVLNEMEGFFLTMAKTTGTLWEHKAPSASCNHGFAAHIARVLYRDVLGVQDISPTEKKVTLRFNDCGLNHCKGSIPVGDESVDIEWTMESGELNANITIPKGYTPVRICNKELKKENVTICYAE